MPRAGVVLAAGRSQRLHALTGGGSKALVRLGGMTLVERAVLTLLRAGLERVVVVVGYHAGPVAAVVSRLARGRVRPVEAPRWELGNGMSLAAAEAALSGEDRFVLVTADHVFADGALWGLLRARAPAVLVDPAPTRAAWEEGTRVRVDDGLALRFGKDLDERTLDCGAFLLPEEVFECQRAAAARGDHSLAGAVSRLAKIRPMRAVSLPEGSWWQDVDTPEDLRQATRRLRRSLAKASDGPVARVLNRPLSTRLSMGLAPLRLSPDLVSGLSFLIALAAAWFLWAGRGVPGGILAQAASVLDGVDGEIARLRLVDSPRGALLDGLLDRLSDAAILAAVGVWALRAGSLSGGAVLALTVTAVVGAMLSMASKDRINALGLPPAPERKLGLLLGGRDGRVLLIAIGAVLGRPVVALAAVAVAAGLTLVARVAITRHRLSPPRG